MAAMAGLIAGSLMNMSNSTIVPTVLALAAHSMRSPSQGSGICRSSISVGCGSSQCQVSVRFGLAHCCETVLHVLHGAISSRLSPPTGRCSCIWFRVTHGTRGLWRRRWPLSGQFARVTSVHHSDNGAPVQRGSHHESACSLGGCADGIAERKYRLSCWRNLWVVRCGAVRG